MRESYFTCCLVLIIVVAKGTAHTRTADVDVQGKDFMRLFPPHQWPTRDKAARHRKLSLGPYEGSGGDRDPMHGDDDADDDGLSESSGLLPHKLPELPPVLKPIVPDLPKPKKDDDIVIERPKPSKSADRMIGKMLTTLEYVGSKGFMEETNSYPFKDMMYTLCQIVPFMSAYNYMDRFEVVLKKFGWNSCESVPRPKTFQYPHGLRPSLPGYGKIPKLIGEKIPKLIGEKIPKPAGEKSDILESFKEKEAKEFYDKMLKGVLPVNIGEPEKDKATTDGKKVRPVHVDKETPHKESSEESKTSSESEHESAEHAMIQAAKEALDKAVGKATDDDDAIRIPGNLPSKPYFAKDDKMVEPLEIKPDLDLKNEKPGALKKKKEHDETTGLLFIGLISGGVAFMTVIILVVLVFLIRNRKTMCCKPKRYGWIKTVSGDVYAPTTDGGVYGPPYLGAEDERPLV